MKNTLIITASILLLCLSLPACKFNFGTNGTTSNSDSSNASRTTAKTENQSKTSASKSISSKDDKTEIAEDDEDGGDLTASESAPDSESDTSQATDFRIKRSYYALDENRPDDMMTRDGDYDYFKELEGGGTAGFYYSTKPQKAQYVLWDGEVIAGPMTTDKQIKEVAATISKNMRNEHEMRMNLIKNRPTGILGPSRVYDQNGKLIREQ
jgi:hypothetical protein